MSEVRSLDRERAQFGWTCIQEAEHKKNCGEGYYSLIRSFPSMVQSTGIGQAVAFLMAKKSDSAHELLLEHLRHWLVTKNVLPWSEQTVNANRQASPKQLLEMLLAETPAFWWAADRETIEFCSWLKRYSEFYHATQAGRR